MRLICSTPTSLRTSFVPDNLLASHQPLEVPVGPGGMDVVGSVPHRGTPSVGQVLLQDSSCLCQSKAEADVSPFPWTPGPSCHGDVSSPGAALLPGWAQDL